MHLSWEVACLIVHQTPGSVPSTVITCICILYDVKERTLNLFPSFTLTDVQLPEMSPALSTEENGLWKLSGAPFHLPIDGGPESLLAPVPLC